MSLAKIYSGVLATYYGTKKAELERSNLLYRYVYRPLSFPLTALFIALGISANQLSVANIFLLLLSVYFLSATGLMWLGAALFLLFYVVDFADGNIARYHGTSSYFGKLIDGFIDTIAFIVFAAVAYGDVASGNSLLPEEWEIFLGIGATLAALIRQNYRFRLAYLKLEAAGGVIPSAVATGSSGGIGLLKAVYENVMVSTPLLLLALIALKSTTMFVIFFFCIHCALGTMEIVWSLFRNRSALAIYREH